MKFTGERFHPEIKEFWSIEHLHRYKVIQNICKSRIILDVACGEGYGSSILSEVASCVYGVDISKEAIKHASNKYSNKKIKFIHANGENLPFDNNFFDIIVSFETIEHLDQTSFVSSQK
jgi:ubiquinone/menaquinone biosynthesis C-methylase UbiE